MVEFTSIFSYSWVNFASSCCFNFMWRQFWAGGFGWCWHLWASWSQIFYLWDYPVTICYVINKFIQHISILFVLKIGGVALTMILKYNQYFYVFEIGGFTLTMIAKYNQCLCLLSYTSSHCMNFDDDSILLSDTFNVIDLLWTLKPY